MTMHNSCEAFEARLEDAAQIAAERGEQIALDADLSAHVSDCAHCRESLEAVTISRSLLRAGLAPTGEPNPFFAERVMAVIRAEEQRQAAQGSIFWSPLQHLAARMAMVAGVVVMALTVYLYSVGTTSSSVATAQNDTSYELVPHQQLEPQPQSKDDVLMSLVERPNAR
jgi:negative regulator of sigma E activity